MNMLVFFLASLALHGAVIVLPIRFADEGREEPVPVKLYVEPLRWPAGAAEPKPKRPKIKTPEPARTAQTTKTIREKRPKITKARSNVAASKPRLLPNPSLSPYGSDLQQIEEPLERPTAHSQAANPASEPDESRPEGTDSALKILTATLNPAPDPFPDEQATVPKSGDSVEPPQSEALTQARYFYNPPPEYPERAKKAGWEGTVFLQVLIDPRGMPERVEIDHSSGFAVLDEAARQSVAKWRFHPAHAGKRQIPSTVRIPIVFTLVDAAR